MGYNSLATVESGVLKTLKSLGIDEPSTALEIDAILLARTLDNCTSVEDKKLIASLSRELRLTLVDIADQPQPKDDRVADLAGKHLT
jgi:hypothetical protein